MTPRPREESEPVAASSDAQRVETSRRIHSYDLYRGLLLVAMFVWHVLLNLTHIPLHADYFRWISMGFVMFLGVGLARFLRYKTRKKLWLVLKLFATFYLLNIPNYFKSTFDPMLLITGSQLHLSFEVLFPMGLLILLSIPLDRFRRYNHLLAGGIYLAVVAAMLAGVDFYNLRILLYGLLGYFLSSGLDLDRIARTRSLWPTLLALVTCSIPFVVRRFGYYFDFLFVLYVLALYLLVARWIRANQPLEFIGRNSFVIYVAQIIVVKTLNILIFQL